MKRILCVALVVAGLAACAQSSDDSAAPTATTEASTTTTSAPPSEQDVLIEDVCDFLRPGVDKGQAARDTIAELQGRATALQESELAGDLLGLYAFAGPDNGEVSELNERVLALWTAHCEDA